MTPSSSGIPYGGALVRAVLRLQWIVRPRASGTPDFRKK